MNLQRLHYFGAVVREGGLRAAADALAISQPALTRHIQALEHELGVTLFERVRGRLQLTEAGRLLFTRLPVLEAELEFLKNGLRAAGSAGSRALRVGALQSLLEYVVPHAIMALRRQQPTERLAVFGFSTAQILARVIAGEYDVGVVAGTPDDRRLAAVPLFTEPFAALIASAHPFATVPQVDMSALFGEELVTFPRQFTIREMLESAARRARLSLRIAAEIEAISGIKSLALANVGIAPLPISALASEAFDARCRVIPLAGAELERTINAVYRIDAPPSGAVLRLLDEMCSVAARRIEGVRILRPQDPKQGG